MQALQDFSSAMIPPSAAAAGVLIASADAEFRRRTHDSLAAQTDAAAIAEAAGGAEALAQIAERLETAAPTPLGGLATVLLDRWLPDLEAEELAAQIRSSHPWLRVEVVDSRASGRGAPRLAAGGAAPAAFAGLRTGAGSGTEEGLAPATAAAGVAAPRAGEEARRRRAEPLPGMLGRSAAMERFFHLARLVARRDTTLLITGESGTGKELVARAAHELSARAGQPWVVMNCAAIPDALIEAELFGHARGAFTGAVQARVGRAHAAHRGTLFLDEIGELPLGLQAKLLRFLQEGEVQRLGASDVFKVDARVIAASNGDLKQKVAKGEFRQDLYYRLAIFPLELPPLRARRGDAALLAREFLAEFARRENLPLARLSAATLSVIEAYAWPGNVRQLRHAIERAAILAADEASFTASATGAAAEIQPWHLPAEVTEEVGRE